MSSFTRLSAATNVISALSDTPNVTDGLNAAQLKAKFDKAGDDIKTFINSSLIAELEASGAAEKLGIAEIAGMLATNIQAALAELYGLATAGIADGSVTTPKIHDGDVTTTKLADAAVTVPKLAANVVRYRFDGSGSGITVAANAWGTGHGITGYPYRADIALSAGESLVALRPEVIFSASDSASGNFASVAESHSDGVYIYAAAAPEAAITIPVIELWR